MPEFPVDRGQRLAAEGLVELVAGEYERLRDDGRAVFWLLLARRLGVDAKRVRVAAGIDKPEGG